MTFYVYIIQSLADHSYYKGSTQDISESKATSRACLIYSRKIPWKLVYLEFMDQKGKL